MTNLKNLTFLFVAVFGVIAVFSPQARSDSAYQRMDRETMTLTLRKMQMSALLEAFAEETGDNSLKVQALMTQAASAGEEQRDKILARAAELVKGEIKRLKSDIRQHEENEGEKFEDAVVKYFQARMLYINLLVPSRTKPYVDRLTYLLGGEEDRRGLGKLASEGTSRAKKMQRVLEKILGDSREPTMVMRQVYLVPELENIQKKLDYWGAYIRYYDAISQRRHIPDEDNPGQVKLNRKRIKLLKDAQKTITAFASDPELPDIHPNARLLLGQCQRELEKFAQAQKSFASVIGQGGQDELFVEASFAAVRNLIEWGARLIRQGDLPAGQAKMNQAQALTKKFLAQAQARQLQSQLAADVKKMVLDYYLHQQWAEALRTARKEPQAKAQDKAVQQVFKDFLAKHKDPAVRVAVGELFRKKFRGTKDFSKLDPAIVLLLGDLELAQAKKLHALSGDAAPAGKLKDAIQKHCDQAEKMYRSIVARRKNPGIDTLVPDAMWGLGEVYVIQRDNFKSAQTFRELVKLYPKHPRAYLAAINAVKITNELINMLEQQGQAVPRKRLEEYAASLRVMLKTWGDKPQAVQYHFDLGYTAGRLAEGAASDEKYKALLAEAIANYDKVPADNDLSRWAQAEALDLHFKMLTSAPKPDKAQAASLMNKLNKYGADIHGPWQRTTDKEKKMDWGNWGSRCEFNAQVLANEVLGQRDSALEAIEKIPARWPGTAVLEDAQEYAIRQRVQRGDVDEAIEQLKAFEKQYGPQKAEGLMELVVRKIRQAIRQRLASGDKPAELVRYRQAYLKFAQSIYKTRSSKSDQGQKNQITAMLADALVQSDTAPNATRALKLYQQLRKDDQAQRQREVQKITSKIEQKLQALSQAKRSVASARAANAELYETLKALEMKDWRGSSLASVKYAIRKMERGVKDGQQTPEQSQANVQAVFKAIARAYKAMGKSLKSKTSVNASIILGLARCYKKLGLYNKALEQYHTLAAGLTPQIGHDMYWQSQLELCQCILAAHKKDVGEINRLVVLIGQLRNIDENLGGRQYIGRFGRVETDAKAIIEKNK